MQEWGDLSKQPMQRIQLIMPVNAGKRRVEVLQVWQELKAGKRRLTGAET